MDNSATKTAVPVTRTHVILAAVRKLIEERRTLLDAADDLGALTFTVKLHAGTAVVKSVVVSEERITRRL